MSGRKRKTKRWLQEHRSDHYVRRADAEGYRSRAAFKLEQIDRKNRLLRSGMTVVELGAAPGGWSQYLARRLRNKGRLITLDLLPMQAVSGVEHLQGDFTDPSVRELLKQQINNAPVDLVISDMAPNITGIAATDEARRAELWSAVLEFSREILAPGGSLLLKLFAGDEAQQLRQRCKQLFSKSLARKPDASRAHSSEYYLFNQGFRGR